MPNYTTGELAKLCNVSVRTVQFYDAKELLKPAVRTEGDRRLYSDEGLKKMRLICLLKSLGLSLDSIKGILKSDYPERVLLLLLDEQEKILNSEISEKQMLRQTISVVRNAVKASRLLSVESIGDIDKIMKESKELRKLHGTLLALGIPSSLILWSGIVIWIVTGVWWPFAVCVPVVILISCLLSALYYRNTAYICPHCGVRFKPSFREMFWARHTPKTRKLTCTVCGYHGWCVETIPEKQKENEV